MSSFNTWTGRPRYRENRGNARNSGAPRAKNPQITAGKRLVPGGVRGQVRDRARAYEPHRARPAESHACHSAHHLRCAWDFNVYGPKRGRLGSQEALAAPSEFSVCLSHQGAFTPFDRSDSLTRWFLQLPRVRGALPSSVTK